MKGVLLAGGKGTRLYPLTRGLSKQLLPVFDKPLVFYPLSTLLLSGVRDVLVVTTEEALLSFEKTLSPFRSLGLSLDFAVQSEPRGIADALVLAGEFVGDDPVCLVLGDNLFHGPSLGESLKRFQSPSQAEIFALTVADPENYAVVEFSADGTVKALEEKPTSPTGHWVVPGLYFYPPGVCQLASTLTPSARGELEITDLNRIYMDAGQLHVSVLPRGTAWFDAGSVESLSDAAEYVRVVQRRQGALIACVEEIAWRNGWVSLSQAVATAEEYSTSVAAYLRSLDQAVR